MQRFNGGLLGLRNITTGGGAGGSGGNAGGVAGGSGIVIIKPSTTQNKLAVFTSTGIFTAQTSTVTSQTSIGEVELPSVNNVETTAVVTGNSPAVVLNIYKTITGSNLSAIISATGFTGTTQNISTLADFLDIKKVINPLLLPQVTALGVNSLSDVAEYLNSRVNQKTFKNWFWHFILNLRIQK